MTSKALLSALLCGFLGALAPLSASAAPVQWSSNGHWYEAVPWFVTDPDITSWAAANAAAMGSTYLGMTGHLATITSGDENAFISGLTPRDQSAGARPLYYMLGGFQDPAAATAGAGWMWVTGEPFVFTNWNADAGEPNNHNVTEGNSFDEDRLGFWGTTTIPNGLTWNDLTGTFEPYGYVVEYSMAAIPEPQTYALLLAGLGLLGFAARRRRK